MTQATTDNLYTATFGGGCFWCTEAIFQRLRGVTSVVSGYAGGSTEDPTYEQVSSGATGHAEAVQITFDPQQITYQALLDIFWHTHNPTTPNQQGADMGSQYRSVIFYQDQEQKQIAEKSQREFDESEAYPNPAVTQIVPLHKFYPAEQYHQKYYQSQPNAPYCQIVIRPKLQKLLQQYQDLVKTE